MIHKTPKCSEKMQIKEPQLFTKFYQSQDLTYCYNLALEFFQNRENLQQI